MEDLEDLGAILRRVQKQAMEGGRPNDAELVALEEADQAERAGRCPTCQDRRFISNRGALSECQTCGPQRQAERALRTRQRFPEAQRENTFAGIDKRRDLSREDNERYQDAVRACIAFASGDASFGWLLLAGNPGWGKTHLAICICNYRIDHLELGLPQANYAVVPDLIGDLRQGVGDDTFEDKMRAYQECGLLVLDDLGKERSTPWAQEQLYRMLNHRYAAQAPTVITTNTSISQVDPAIADRLIDQRTGLVKIFDLGLPSFRSGKVWR
jgi:DNA replication protein DnaC